MRLLLSILLSVLAICGLSSCGRSGPPIPEKEILAAVNFDVPLITTVSLRQQVDANGNLSNSEDAPLLALFQRAGIIRTEAYQGGAPWWRFAMSVGTLTREQLSIEAARREIAERSEEKYWSEGSVEFYAETIAYKLVLSPAIAGAINNPSVTGSLRIVLRNDPAVGKWKPFFAPERGTKWLRDDSEVIRDMLELAGKAFVPELGQQIQRARTTAFDTIERQLANDGTLEKDARDSRMLVSKKHKLRYNLGSTFRISQGVTLGQLKQYCRDSNVGKFAWRLPTIEELGTIFGSHNFFNGTALINTPDNRLWSDFAIAASPGFYILSSTAKPYISYTATSHIFNDTAYRLELQGSQFISQFQLTNVSLSGADLDTARATGGYGGDYFVKVLCVAPL